MRTNYTVAAAVAAVLGSATVYAAAPLLSDIQNTQNASGTPNVIYIGGSSAISVALLATIQNNFCGGASNATTIKTSSSGNTNFLGVACTPASGKATNGGNYNVWIRYEGGSVTGFLPVVNSANPINFLDPTNFTTDASGNIVPPLVNGSSASNGTLDSFQGPLSRHIPDLGIGDVEAKALIGANYPSDYDTTVWGPNNAAGLYNLTTAGVVDEVYALYVNTSGGHFTSQPVSLSLQTIQEILNGKFKNWSIVHDTNGNAVTASSVPITLVNREFGSGSRAAADILMAGDSCAGNGSSSKLAAGVATRYFSTGDVLGATNTSAEGAITYASIDNTPGNAAAKTTNLTLISINGVAPSNLAAASNAYPFWVEANFYNNAAFNTHDALAVNSIIAALQSASTTASLADIDAIPSITDALGVSQNTTGLHLYPTTANGSLPSGGGTNKDGTSSSIYTNAYKRSNITCSIPSPLTLTP